MIEDCVIYKLAQKMEYCLHIDYFVILCLGNVVLMEAIK